MKRTIVMGSLAAAIGLCSSGAAAQQLTGAGATFPNPIYSKWFSAYSQKTGVQINYQSIGSGGGIKQYTEGTVDFGASDGPMTNDQMSAVQGKVYHIPTVLGADVLTYNLPAIGTAQLKFDGPSIAGIFLGTITKWNDPRLVALNPGVKLPGDDIIVAHRSDGSGTTYIFTDYLSKVSPEWKEKVGFATSVNWPVGLGGKGNEGVTGLVKQTPNAIGYVELVYAIQNKLPYAEIRNATGRFVKPTLESVTAAAGSAAANMPADFRVSITNPTGPDAYPIASFTWLLIPTRYKEPETARALKQFLEWMLEAGQSFATPLSYAPLPPAVVELERKALSKIEVGGQ